ncbi:beta-lactamase [Hirsutella rhossiliensis]|uniref:Beta-lactamase domain-containing protein n=1 Tax=Hirsutella rhossiliensis TaxID=111463 RepID=A0A9P8SD74_9HYPO|nr:beta-lactamase domain-containing protein [Hirsutella rhossiliensis]KAH0958306.1 beta-lactamase domain-containing protein [Hirsutella rhossiliensis]
MALIHSPMLRFSDDFSAQIKELIEECHVPGLALAVVQGDEVASAGFGKATLDPPRDCTADTLFDIASASKSLTAASVALLVNDDEKYPDVKYDAAMSALLPDDFVMPGNDHDDVTVEDILSHRTGMAAHDTSYMSCGAPQPDDARSITRNLRNLAVVAPNRTKYIYCNMMYTVASYLVERKSGLDFPSFLEENFFRPLSMDSTNLHPRRAIDKGLGERIAAGYVWDEEGGKYNETPWSDSFEAQGAGCIITSVNDYIKWVQAMVKREGPITEDVFRGLTEKRMRQDQSGNQEENEGIVEGAPGPPASSLYYAAGWEVREYRGHTIVSHDGSEDGFRSNHFFLPQIQFGGVIVGNSDRAAEVVDILTEKLINNVLQVESESESTSTSESGSEAESDGKSLSLEDELRQELCPGIDGTQPRTRPLSDYTGKYRNTGYRTIEIGDKDGELYVDATDRSMGYTMTFNHVCDQTKFIAYMSEKFVKGDSPVKAEFVFDGERAVKVGICLEESLKDYIWFERV